MLKSQINVLRFTIGSAISILAALGWAFENTPRPTGAYPIDHPELQGGLAAIDAWLEGVHIYDRIPGVSVGIVIDQDLVWQNAYGYSNLENGQRTKVNTLYSICSISKLFTATAIMQLRDAGKLTLTDAVTDHLEWFRINQSYPDGGPITIEGLLTHSSGLPRESDFPYWNGPDFQFPTRRQLIDRLESQRTLYPSRQYFQYSNLGFTIAGEIVKAASGISYADYVREKILEPLELSDTKPSFPVDLHGARLAIGYSGLRRSGARKPVGPFFTRSITPAAGFTSSVGDLAKFASWQFRLLEGRDSEVLNKNTLREMHRVHWMDPDWTNTRGLGFVIEQLDDVTIVRHGGGCPGYATEFSMVPEKKVAAVVLTNAGNAAAKSMAHNILQVLIKALGKTENSPIGKPSPDLTAYEGNYEKSPWGGEIAIRQWGDRLAVINIPSNDIESATNFLEYVGNDEFVRLTDNEDYREPWNFELTKDGRAGRVYRHSIYLDRIQ